MATVTQPSLFAVVEVGSPVAVYHESGDLEGYGVAVAPALMGGQACWLVRLDRGITVCRPALRVVVREWFLP